MRSSWYGFILQTLSTQSHVALWNILGTNLNPALFSFLLLVFCLFVCLFSWTVNQWTELSKHHCCYLSGYAIPLLLVYAHKFLNSSYGVTEIIFIMIQITVSVNQVRLDKILMSHFGNQRCKYPEVDDFVPKIQCKTQ